MLFREKALSLTNCFPETRTLHLMKIISRTNPFMQIVFFSYRWGFVYGKTHVIQNHQLWSTFRFQRKRKHSKNRQLVYFHPSWKTIVFQVLHPIYKFRPKSSFCFRSFSGDIHYWCLTKHHCCLSIWLHEWKTDFRFHEKMKEL